MHIERAWVDQTSLWPASSVTQLYRHPDVYAWVIERLELDQLRVRERQDRARTLLRRCSELRPPPVGSSDERDRSGADRVRVPRVTAALEPELAREIEMKGLIEPAYGTCLRCAVVRPIAALHVLRSAAIPGALHVCAGREPPPDRLGHSVDDHWGSPCACRQCRASLGVIGIDPITDQWFATAPLSAMGGHQRLG